MAARKCLVKKSGEALSYSDLYAYCIGEVGIKPDEYWRLTEAETKVSAPLGLPDQSNLLYEVGGDPVQYGKDDFVVNVGEYNFIMRNNRFYKDIVIFNEALFDDNYLLVAPHFDITVVFNELTILTGGGGDYVNISSALAALSTRWIWT